MKNKPFKIIIIIFIVIYILSSIVSLSPETFQQFFGDITSTDYARITDIEYKAVLIDEENKTFSEDIPATGQASDYYDLYNNIFNNIYDSYHEKEISQSKVVVTETITFDVRAASKDNPFWELWLGLGEEDIDGIRRTYKVNSVKEVLPDGNKITWQESPQLYWDDSDYTKDHPYLGPYKWFHSEGPYDEDARRYECLMFYVDGIYREKIKFEIEYEIYNAVLKYEDCSELYIPMYSGETIKHLNSFKGEILIADKDMPEYWNYEATGFGTQNGSFDLEKSTTKNKGYTTFSFDLDKKDLKFLKGYEYLEFDMYSKGADKHIFADYATDNDYSNSPALDEVIENRNYYLEAPSRYKSMVFTANIIVLLIGLVVLLVGILRLINTKKKFPSSKTENKSDYIFREIPSDIDPKFAAELVFIKDLKPPKNSEDAIFASLLLSLARKKYIKLTDSGNDTIIKILQPETKQQTQTTESSPLFCAKTYSTQINGEESYVSSKPIYGTTNEIREIKENRESLTYCEQQYYNLLLRHVKTGHITISDLEKRISLDNKFASDFQDKIKLSNINTAGPYPYTTQHIYNYVKDSLKKFGKNYVKLGIAILVIGNLFSILSAIGKPLFACFAIGIASILLGTYTVFQSKHCVSLTPFGEQEYQKWRGLYNFLKSDTLLTERTHVELPLWEKYLVYATAFGISEKVVDAIRIRCIVVPPQTSIASTNHYHIRHICRRSASVRRSIRTSSHSYRSSSYGGRYNAGGRGIGGGGGGH